VSFSWFSFKRFCF